MDSPSTAPSLADLRMVESPTRMGRPPLCHSITAGVLALAIQGCSKQSIAKALGVSRPTVRRTINLALLFDVEPAFA